jgi:hypothetical protein
VNSRVAPIRGGRVAQTCGSLHVCDRTDAWLTVMRPQREGKHNSQTRHGRPAPPAADPPRRTFYVGDR